MKYVSYTRIGTSFQISIAVFSILRLESIERRRVRAPNQRTNGGMARVIALRVC